MSVVIVSRRKTKEQARLSTLGYAIVDVTSKSPSETFQKFSPFYPVGGIPVPGNQGMTAESVEGIWQGLKVFEKEGIDATKFRVKNMKNIKRATGEKRGRVLGHKCGDVLLDYVTARHQIYLPVYDFVLKNRLAHEVALLVGMLKENTNIVLLDYETNEDPNDTSSPLSHASLIKTHVMKMMSEE